MSKNKIFLLSITEIKKYLPTEESSKCKCKEEFCWWWLRSPGHNMEYVASVDANGYLYDYGICITAKNAAVRPALYINPDYLKTLERSTDGCVEFGRFTWLVLDEETGLLLAKETLPEICFDKVKNDYDRSEIRASINGLLYRWFFTNEEQAVIMDAVIEGEISYPVI